MVYIIRKNRHRAGWFLKFTCKNKISGVIKFLGDVSYFVDKQFDSNKIVGLSDNWHHHKDSARLGWRYDKIGKVIEIMTITYVRGKRTIKHLCYTTDNDDKEFEIIITKNSYIYRFDTAISIVPRRSKWKLPRLILHPYFGGRTKSPKNIYLKITIDE